MSNSQIGLGFLLLAFRLLSSAGGLEADEENRGKYRYSAYPEVQSVDEGISWPKGQALPVFARPARTLDAIEVQALSTDERITVSALQGLVNKKKPRIYLLDARADQGRDTWATTSTIGLGARNLYDRESKYDLVAKYAGEVEGVVLCPKLAADGTPSTMWSSSKEGKRWLRFDFGDTYQITRYVIRHAGENGLTREHNTRGYTVEASTDGSSWKTVDAYRGNTENVTDVDLDPVGARYVKLTVDDSGGDATARIADVELFGKRLR